MIDGRFDIIATRSLLGLRGYNLNNLELPLEGNKNPDEF